jgi:WD40 repeat protein
VYSFPWPLPSSLHEKYSQIKSLPYPNEQNALTKESDERFMGTLLLSHSSSVLCSVVSSMPFGNKILITGDRDEHIRISFFPETHIIHAMALEHSGIVSCLLKVHDYLFVSGGGDNEVILWDFNGKIKAKNSISSGSCVRLLRRWNDTVIAVGERYIALTLFLLRSSLIEIFSLSNGLEKIQSLNVPQNILDVEIRDNALYVSLDSQSEPWIIPYEQINGEWAEKQDNLTLPNVERKESIVPLYWLESMKKRFRGDDREE